MAKPSIAKILDVMPGSSCLDSEEDASGLATHVCMRLGLTGRTGAVFQAIYGEPWCSDNEPERRKIARKIRGAL